MTYLCIKPHCPLNCDQCNYAIPDEPGARRLIVELLDEFANDGHGATMEEGDHPLVDKARAFVCAPQAPERDAPGGDVIEALKFYADRDHFMLADETAWDTVSGEPSNLWCDEAGTATVEDGSIARAALASMQAKPQAVQMTEARKPLTDEQIEEWWARENGLEDCDMCKRADFRKVVRAIEAAHGISASQGKAGCEGK